MKLMLQRRARRHVALDAVAEFEAAILMDARVTPVAPPWLVQETSYRAVELVARFRHSLSFELPARSSCATQRSYFAVMMTLDSRKLLPHYMQVARKGIYLFDAWPRLHDRILDFVTRWGITDLFVSSAMAAERLRARTRAQVHWVPEGVAGDGYRWRPSGERDIDVLQVGRRDEELHEKIVGPARERGIVYRYQRAGQLVFPTREEFLDGLSRSKISICLPSSVTHPERSGDIETMTTRYLQSMASKCLVVGRTPREMIELFSYDPCIEIDRSDPIGQVQSILDRYESYRPLIDRNYQNVVHHHTWSRRWETIAQALMA